MNLDKNAVVVQGEGTLYPWETLRYQETKIAQLHKHLKSTSIGKDGEEHLDDDKTLLTLVTPKVCTTPSPRLGLARSGSMVTISTLSAGSFASSRSTLPQKAPSTLNLAAVESATDAWGHFVDVSCPLTESPRHPYRHFLRRELQSNGARQPPQT
jgi:hypothetical protein